MALETDQIEAPSEPAITPFKAIYLDATGTVNVRTIPAIYTPESPNQVLIRVEYSAINPGDLRHFHMGMHSFAIGYDYTGTVISAHDSSPFKPGDDVMGMTFPGHARPLSHGAHQAYLLADLSHHLIFRRPAGFSPVDAAGFTSPVQTAADAIFNLLGVGLPAAGLDGDDPSDKGLLIWGGASAVGWGAIQLAKAAGFKHIFTTASSRNHAVLKEVGATYVFDYRGSDVAEQIQEAVRKEGIKLCFAVDAVSKGTGVFEPSSDHGSQEVDFSKSTPALTKRALSDRDLDRGEAKLVSSLPVIHDPDFEFMLFSRKWGDEEEKHPGWWERQEKVVKWVTENHDTVWKAMPVKVVEDAEEAVKAIHEVFEGRHSFLKVLLKHPLT